MHKIWNLGREMVAESTIAETTETEPKYHLFSRKKLGAVVFNLCVDQDLVIYHSFDPNFNKIDLTLHFSPRKQ